VRGILNGIDYAEWNPTEDPRLPAPFAAESIELRRHNRHALQNLVGLPQTDFIPLIGMVSRLDWQKGLDITGHVIHLLMNGFAGEAQFVVLGTGAGEYEAMFAQMAGYHKQKMAAILEFNAALAPLIYAGSDMFIMPSLFEPCGLGQLIAMRYGSVPVVKETGGLADTVQDSVTGFSFRQHTVEDFWQAIQRAVHVYNADKEKWREIQLNGMNSDYSWERSAVEYVSLYSEAIARHR
jgi:starch synthase